MTTDRILRRLCDVRASGTGWMASCPAHEDQTPSLSICVGNDGRTLLKCHAGCSVEEIVRAMGLSIRDLFAQPGRRFGTRKRHFHATD
jgi:putative DNA primase/helicase